MISRIASMAAPWAAAVAFALAMAVYLHSTKVERDSLQREVTRQQERADILLEHKQWQRQQIETLHDSLARRDETLAALADDMRASRDALDQLGEQNAEIRDWLDRDVPAGIDDWVRQLQQPSTGNGVRLPNDTGTADE